MQEPVRSTGAGPGIRFREFVGLVAAMMAINAIGIDIMLPALPEIGHALGVVRDNDRQWIIAAYVLGFGSFQLVYGPLADQLGRKPVLVVTLALFAITSLVAAFADTFPTMIAARGLQGICAASSRVLAVSIVRDCYSGRQMARVMSTSFIVFLAVPVLAPSIGQLILLVAPWQAIFVFLALFGAGVAAWAGLRLAETLHPGHRQKVSLGSLRAAFATVLGDRYSVGYTLGSAVIFGSLMGFINSSQQIFVDIFRAPHLFPIIFAGIAATMGVAALINARNVERHGTRIISHAALLGFIAVAGLHLVVAGSGHEGLLTFAVLQAAAMFCVGLIASNFNTMAMARMGHIAGTAASAQGFVSTIGGALVGIAIGQSFDGTTVPLAAGFLVAGLVALAIVLVTERGRLFRPLEAPAAAE